MKGLLAAISALGVFLAVVAVPVVHRSPEGTYGGADTRLLVLEVVAASALLLLATLGRPRWGAVLVAAVGAAWVLPEVAGGSGVPITVRTLADAVPALLAALLLVALVVRRGVVDRRMLAPLVVACSGAAVASSARLLLVDPFNEPRCWRMCEHNPLSVAGAGAAGEAVLVAGLLALAAGALWAAAVELRAAGGGEPVDPAGSADLAGWLLLGTLVVALLLRLGRGVPSERLGLPLAVFVAAQVGAILWLVALWHQSWVRWRLESRLLQLVGPLGGANRPDAVAGALRDALRDPGLRVWFWAPARGCLVDGEGRTALDTTCAPHEQRTTITRHGRVVAVVVHTRRPDGMQLEHALRPSLRLALENQQLRAAALAELDELSSSRARVVERHQVERRALERNLHDGAQQRAFSLALQVSAFRESCSEVDDEYATRAQDLTQTLLDELRRVAHGIHPTVLADAGLASAVSDLAERSTSLPVALGSLPGGRFPAPVETTAYLVMRAGLADAQLRGAGAASVSGTAGDGVLRLCVEDDGSPAPDRVATELGDQVGALGGRLVVDDNAGRHRIEVVLPCGS